MKSVLAGIVATLVLSGAGSAAAQVTGNALLERAAALKRVESGTSTSGDGPDMGWLNGFAFGVGNALQAVDPQTCLPQGSNTGQLVRVLIQYLETNPAELHKGATALAIAAFRKAFPCR